ncbi:hypothetical protein DMH02_000115 [Streptomyces sp. WAC 00631]|uniref:hypothetical protein n=1 Tax=unclassified Streptomyces TaxID=2593676 RepID=UPI000F796FF7|nr:MULTISPECIES: hypothetical protein [unclassified Streptomyces]MCC5031707.1 hypothetical protein [Streptomyces sp. WAC 00631]MCC9739852.1 hypothetical protein [Streptomyces sp. MNU89]
MPSHPAEPPMGRPTEFGDLSPFTLERHEYLSVTKNPVRCLPVTLHGQLVGYLWASESDTEDAAAFYARRGTGAAGFNAGGVWRGRLKLSKEKGMSPLTAVREWVGKPEHPTGGAISAGSREQTLPNSQAVQELAGRRPQ